MITQTSLNAPGGLSFLWLEITAKCNLECSHCYADSSPERNLYGEMSFRDWQVVLEDGAEVGCRQVQFIGGEPVLHPHLPTLIEHASQCGYSFIEVFTNATAIGERLLATFAKYGVHVATSFYSDDPATHDLITGIPGSFGRTVAAIRRMTAQGLAVRAGIIEMDANRGHVQRARHLLGELGVTNIKVDIQRGVGRGAANLCSLEPMAQLCGECSKGKLCVTSSRGVFPCVFSRFAEVGKVEHGIGNIVNAERLLKFRVELNAFRGSETERNGERSASGCVPKCSPCGPGVFIHQPPCVPESRCNPEITCDPCAP